MVFEEKNDCYILRHHDDRPRMSSPYRIDGDRDDRSLRHRGNLVVVVDFL